MKKSHIHLIVISLGIIFVSLSAFHSYIWFDESYSVAIAKHSLIDIWKITGNDVHPALYYWMLHIIYLIFGSNILIFRLFSVLRYSSTWYFRIYPYKERFWRKSRTFVFFYELFFTDNGNLCRRN